MGSNLCSLAYAKTVMGVTDSAGDAKLGLLIAAVSDAVERECDRHFSRRLFTGWHDGRGHEELVLKEWPISSVRRVSIGSVDALSVRCLAPDASEATAEITDSALSLVVLDGADAGTTLLTLATETPLSSLVTAIGLVPGSWSAQALSSLGGHRSVRLRPSGVKPCRDASASFEMPEAGETDYFVDYDCGTISLKCGTFPRGKRNIYVEYEAGYETIPAALQQIAAEIVRAAYYATSSLGVTSSGGAVKSETLGDYSYTLEDGAGASAINEALSREAMQRRLAPFKNNLV